MFHSMYIYTYTLVHSESDDVKRFNIIVKKATPQNIFETVVRGFPRL